MCSRNKPINKAPSSVLNWTEQNRTGAFVSHCKHLFFLHLSNPTFLICKVKFCLLEHFYFLAISFLAQHFYAQPTICSLWIDSSYLLVNDSEIVSIYSVKIIFTLCGSVYIVISFASFWLDFKGVVFLLMWLYLIYLDCKWAISCFISIVSDFLVWFEVFAWNFLAKFLYGWGNFFERKDA